MKTNIHQEVKTSLHYESGLDFASRKFSLLGAVALMVFAASARAQFVSTVVSNGLAEPNSVATGADDNAYITDTLNDQIVKYNPSTGATISYVGLAGYGGAVNGPGSLARFTFPQGIVVARGGLVVVDQGNQLIRFVTTNYPTYGVASPLAGVAGVVGANNAVGISATFNYPSGVAVDASGNLYVADLGNNLIRKIDNSGSNVVTTVGNTNGYTFLEPTGVALDASGNIYVSDTGHRVICLISNQNVSIIAGVTGVTGYADSTLQTPAEFSDPTGLLWTGTSLLIADTGNDVIRSLTPTNQYGVNYYVVQTVSGVPGKAGTVDGALGTAEFSAPVGFGFDPYDAGYYVVDRGQNGGASLRSLQLVQPLPAPQVPVFGYVTFATNTLGQISPTFNPASIYTFNAPAIIAYTNGANASQSFIYQGPTGSTNLSGPSSPSPYSDTDTPISQSVLTTQYPDSSLSAYSVGPSGERSTNVTARYLFVTANPSIIGTNGATITLQDTTPGALMYATLDGSIPTNTTTAYTNGQVVDFTITSNVTLSVIAYAAGYSPSGVSTAPLSFSNYLANTVSFAPQTTSASSGGTLAVPIYVTLAAGSGSVETIEFRAEVTPTLPDGLSIGTIGGLSFGTGDYYPLVGLVGNGTPFEYYSEPYTNGNVQGELVYTYTNQIPVLSGYGATALLEVPIPGDIPYGSTYSMSIIYPSATSDGNQASVSLVGKTNILTINNPMYLAGDSSPANGYNAGEFGDHMLNNADVNNAMYASVGIRVPFPFTDAYNAMEVWPENLPNGNNTIEMQDWNVILLRAVGLDTNNYLRFWTNGTLVQVPTNWTPGQTLEFPNSAGKSPVNKLGLTSTPPGQVWLRQASISGGTVANASAGSVCSIPVYAKVSAGSSLSGLQFRAILSGNGSAPAPGAISFTPASGIPTPTVLPGLAANDIACFWAMGGFGANLQNSTYIGVIKFTVPSTAQTGQSYAVHFSGVQGAPNMQSLYQLESFPGSVWVNSPALQAASITSDEWKIAFFGSVSNPLAADNIDADGDGMSNWQEYLAGTNPTNAASKVVFGTSSLNKVGLRGVALTWLTAPGKTYTLESSPSLHGAAWTAINTNLGDGNNYQFLQTNYTGAARFYQLRVSP